MSLGLDDDLDDLDHYDNLDDDLDDLDHYDNLDEHFLQQWVQQHSGFFDVFVDEQLLPIIVPKQTRSRKKSRFSVDYSLTNWGKFVVDPEVRDPDSRKGKLFRRRFRVPYTVFCWICTKCK